MHHHCGFFCNSFSNTTISPRAQAPTTASPTTAQPTPLPTPLPTTLSPTPSPTRRATPAPSRDPTPPPSTPQPTAASTEEQPFIDIIVPECPNGVCGANEHSGICKTDCSDIVLVAQPDSDGDGSDQEVVTVRGTMFTVESSRNVMIKSLELSGSTTTDSNDVIEVYARTGGYEGHESDPESWTLVYEKYFDLFADQSGGGGDGSAPVPGATRLPLNDGNGVPAAAGGKVSFFVYTQGPGGGGGGSGFKGVVGFGQDPVIADDGVLEVYRGVEVTGTKWAGRVNDPIAFIGAFRYDVVESIPSNPTPAPTVWDIGSAVGMEKTMSPTFSRDRPLTPPPMVEVTPGVGATPPPASVAVTVSAPTSEPTPKKVGVFSTMVLYHSDLLDEEAQRIWKYVTEKHLHEEAMNALGLELGEAEIEVKLENQNLLEAERRRRLLGSNRSDGDAFSSNPPRSLQSSPSTTPLEIEFTTIIDVPSELKDGYKSQVVESAFDTQTEKMEYIDSLKSQNSAYFGSVERMELEVGGRTGPITVGPDLNDDPRHGGIIGGGGGEGGSNSIIIIASAAGGALALVFFASIFVYHARMSRRRQRRKDEAAAAATSATTAKVYEDKDNKVGTEIDTKSTTALELPSQSYFGTIESKEGEADDISTLGDPYMGDAVNAVMDADNTVGESMVSSQQDYYNFGVGRPRINTGMDSISRFGGSTIASGYGSGTNRITFGDDPTLEDVYQTPSGNNSSTLDGGSFQRLRVVAPPGKLGIVLDNPTG